MSPSVNITGSDAEGHASLVSVPYVINPVSPPISPTAPSANVGSTLQGLTTVTADVTYLTPQVVSNMDFACYVQADVDVTFRNCLFRGRQSSSQVKPALVNFGTKCVSSLLDHCTVVPDFPAWFVTCAAGYGYSVDYCDMSLGSDLIDMWGHGPQYVTNSYLHEFTFWANDPKHVNDATHPGWSHNDAIQNSGGVGNYSTNLIDMHASTRFGDHAILAATYPNLGWGSCMMLTTTNGVHNDTIKFNVLRGGECQIQHPALIGGNKVVIASNFFTLDQHPYGNGSHQMIRATTGSGILLTDVTGNTYLVDPSVPAAKQGKPIDGPRTSAGQYLWDYSF